MNTSSDNSQIDDIVENIANVYLNEESAHEEQALIEEAQTGDKRAFDALCKKYTPHLSRTALKHTDEDNLGAENFLQHVFSEAWEKIDSYDSSGAFPVWLEAILIEHTRHKT